MSKIDNFTQLCDLGTTVLTKFFINDDTINNLIKKLELLCEFYNIQLIKDNKLDNKVDLKKNLNDSSIEECTFYGITEDGVIKITQYSISYTYQSVTKTLLPTFLLDCNLF